MSNTVCLTAVQQKFYNYFVNYHKQNGAFPTPAQTARDLKCSSGGAANAYGNLLLKGCFTNGQPLVNSYNRTHRTVKVQPLNIADVKVQLKPKAAAKPKQNKGVQKRMLIAKLLMDLLGEDKGNAEFIQQLVA